MEILDFITRNYIIILAIYGSIISTLGIILSIYNYNRDKAKIKVNASIGLFSGTSEDGKVFLFIKAINSGRRPITLSSVGIRTSDGGNILMRKISLPMELSEGKSHNEWIELEKLREISCEFAWYRDETDKLYKSKNIKNMLDVYFGRRKKRKKSKPLDIRPLE